MISNKSGGGGNGLNVTITHDALDLTVQGLPLAKPQPLPA